MLAPALKFLSLWFFASFPEAVFSIYLSFLLLGETSHLPFKCDRKFFWHNVIKLLIVSMVYSFIVELTRILVPILIIALLIKTLVMVLLLKIVYRISWLKSISTFLIICMFLSAVEPLITTFLFKISDQNLSELLKGKGDIKYIIYGTVIVRTIQIAFIISLWNIKIMLNNLKTFEIDKKLFFLLMVSLLIVEYLYMYCFLNLINTFNLIQIVIGCLGFLLFWFINYAFLRVYLKVIQGMVKKLSKERLINEKYIDK